MAQDLSRLKNLFAMAQVAYNSQFKTMKKINRVLILILAVLVSACASYGPSDELIGLERTSIIEKLGSPTGVQQTKSGIVLEYARGPHGRHTYFLILDKNDRVQRWEQVLNEKNFEKILPGMTKDQVRSLIGQSFATFALARDRGEVWSYRYETPFCVWFQIEFDQHGVVRSSGDGMPPECITPGLLMGL
jgi:SmpA / OmlA family